RLCCRLTKTRLTTPRESKLPISARMERNAIDDLLVDPVRGFLTRDEQKVRAELEAMEATAERANDDDSRNEVWLYKKVAQAQSSFIRAFAHCKLEEYYSGWCEYDAAERAIGDIQAIVDWNGDPFAVEFMAKQSPRFQSLFPYRIFGSIGLEVRERTCNIC